MIEIGTRVSYEDMANPLREGTIVGDVAGQWAVRWDEDEAVYNLVEVDGIRFHTTVTKHMLENAAKRQTTFRAEGRGHRCGGWDVVDDAIATTTYSEPQVLVQSTIERHRECVECRQILRGGDRFVRRVASRKVGARTVNIAIVTHLRDCTSDAVLAAIKDENVTPHALNTLDNERARRARVGASFDVAQVGGAFDGFTVTSDADMGL